MAITVKLSDGGANTITFQVDSFDGPHSIDFDKYSRSTNATLKQYTIASKKRWQLFFNNIDNTTKTTLKTIYDLRTELEFYEDSAQAKTADVFWKGDFSIVPTGKHRHFLDTIWEGTIILEEV